jgi:hypothetical protein
MTETDILAIVAIVMSAASLGWQAVSWLRSGAVIQLQLGCYNDTATVTVYNAGRAAATITGVSCWGHSPISSLISRNPSPESDPIPFRVPAGGHAKWYFEAVDVYPMYPIYKDRAPLKSKLLCSVRVGINKSVGTQMDVYANPPGARKRRRSDI